MKKPDINKPRFRQNKFFTQVVCEDTYNLWKKDNPELAIKINSYNSFVKYWRYIADGIIKEVCNNTFGVKLPYYCGELSLKYIGADLKPTNIKKSLEIESKVEHLNWNSSEKVGKMVWNTERASRFNAMIKYYGFKGVRRFNVEVNKALNNHPEIFKTVGATNGHNRREKQKVIEILKQKQND